MGLGSFVQFWLILWKRFDLSVSLKPFRAYFDKWKKGFGIRAGWVETDKEELQHLSQLPSMFNVLASRPLRGVFVGLLVLISLSRPEESKVVVAPDINRRQETGVSIRLNGDSNIISKDIV
jgi:hypothetical protein